MMLAYLALFKWMLACAGGLLAGLTVWAALAAASRQWPALLSRRAVWLAAQGVIIAATLLPFIPSGDRLSVAPPVMLSSQEASVIRDAAPVPAVAITPAAPISIPGPTPAALDATAPAAAFVDAPKPAPTPTLMLPALWLLIYAAGLAFALARLLRARRLWRDLQAAARRLSAQELMEHGAFNNGQLGEIARQRLTVLEVDAAISPMLIGVLRPRLLLPRHLRGFSAEQQHMIVAHELHHWRQRDPLQLGVAAALQTIFWFNPALRWIGGKLEWSLELACDQTVLAGRSQQQRKQYAAALLQQWQAQTSILPAGGVAFGGVNGTTAAARIRHLQRAGLPPLSRAAVWMTGALMVAVLAAGALLQPALAFSVPDASKTSNASGASNASAPSSPPKAMAAAPQVWRYPLDKMRVTGFFGVHRDIMATPHRGIDLAAAKGTPVHAVADGIVIAAGTIAEHDGRYGNTVIIEHGAQRSLYAHLDSVAVKVGDRVTIGQRIGAVGETGFATGPHLHLEVRQDGRIIDPATMLANLDAHATKRALKVRQQQLPTGI
jgi:murein DD-endopeptidase MepM/ murein hydrolase activator NlpD